MAQLTEERFEEILTAKLAPLATKQQVNELKDQIEDLARMTSHGFEDVLERLDVRDRVQKLEHDMKELRGSLHLSS